MEQIRVLIVDDDKIIVNDLLKIIDWNAYGFKVVATAYNGKPGIARCRELAPHIILTDIKMPVMDGLEMISTIKKEGYDAEFVILSSYGEFEYAQQAISLGANAYILKSTLSAATLLEILLPLKERIITQVERSYLTIYNIVHSCLEETHSDLPTLLNDLDRAFKYYLDGIAHFGLQKLEAQVAELIEACYKRYGKSDFFSRKACSTKRELQEWIKDQLVLISRWVREAQDNTISPIISKAVLYIETNYAQKHLNVKDMAQSLAISVSWLSVCFKKETGLTIKDYIRKERIDHAKALLQQGNHKVYEVADLVGFRSSQYFSKTFYQETGQLPQNFRRDTDL